MANIDVKAKLEAAKQKAKQAVAKHKRSKDPAVIMPEPTGNPEVDSKADLDAVQQGFRDRIKNESNRFELATDSEYWFAACFQTREQKEAFLKAIDLLAHGDKYIDGRLLAEKLGITLPDADVPYRTEGKIDKDYAQFVD
ncbi:hypothetical protein [Neisseria shayeganii]|uniref:Uncharacterized protein n=1 Tax=Neisseria shayeganii 871 TaxID=1032488 RepID=G4CG85_9NEIS|nr:hypothetical protein [Neisseria shayeganii]EGY53133.1 hypothetical protein HMPREF9371_0624 [Neisseria shayeganii 871]